MARLVAGHGWRGVRTTALAREANVSKSTLYWHFESMEDCFGVLHDQVVGEAAMRVEEACGRGADPRGRLSAGLGSLVGLIRADPDAARLVLVTAHELGAAGLPLRRGAAARFEGILVRAFAAEEVSIPPGAATAIVAGVGGVLRRRLRSGRAGGPGDPTAGLVAWALRVAAEEDRERSAPPATHARRSTAAARELPWDEAPRSAPARRLPGRRERLVRAAAWVTATRGYDALSIPAISHAGASSNAEFYRHFLHRCEPLLEAFDLLAARMLAACRAVATPPPTLAGAAAAGTRALRAEGSAGVVFARLAFVGLPSIDEVAMDRADKALDALADTLLAARPAPPSPIAAEADRRALAGLLEVALLPDATTSDRTKSALSESR